jgi:hypothetical protein
MELTLDRAEQTTRKRAERYVEKLAEFAAAQKAGHATCDCCGRSCGADGCCDQGCLRSGGCCGPRAPAPVKCVRIMVPKKSMTNTVRATWAYQTYGQGFKLVSRGWLTGGLVGRLVLPWN